jgi:hypothetical protein
VSEREGPQVEQDGRVIRIPMTFKKRGGRKEIIVPEGLPLAPKSKPAQEPLVVALTRAHHWQALLDSGRFATITELAQALKVDRSYVSRMLRLALLAPDIVEAILWGREPSGISYRTLIRRFPLLWSEQREILDFARQ